MITEDDYFCLIDGKNMNKKKIILTAVLSLIACFVIVLSIILINNQTKAKYDGTIIVDVIDLDGKEMKKKSIGFKEGETLVQLIEANFENVVFEDTGYGPFLKEIEGYKTPDDWSSYISVYVDNEYSQVGIGLIEFEDGTYISFRIETYNG